MKKILLIGIPAILLASCQTVTNTSRTEMIQSSARSATVADLDVYPDRVTATLQVGKSLMRGGEANVKHAAEAEALAKYGKGDLLLEPQYVVKKKRGLLRTRIVEISVSGRPASYKNFRSLNDSVWTNPVFNGVKVIRGNSTAVAAKPANTAGGKEVLDMVPKKKRNWREAGFTGILELKAGGADEKEVSKCDVGFDVTLGYQFDTHWMAGVGCGYSETEPCESDISNLRLVPVFAQARWYPLKTRLTPYVDCRLGYSIPCYSTLSDEETHLKNSDLGGLYFSPSIGLAYTTKRDHTITLAFVYKFNRIKDIYYNDYSHLDEDHGKHTIGASLGFVF